jgi:ATP/maltotriose-dependent transcriptional regulator MalT
MDAFPDRLDGRLAWLNNGQCRYQEAMVAAQQGCEYPDDLGFAAWSMVELVEAAVRSNRAPEAVEAFDRLLQFTGRSNTDWALGIEARCRALLEAGSKAEMLYCEAIERLGRTRVRTELARAHLLYGEWLRRVDRRSDARTQLRTAYEMLEHLGLEGFVERAKRELLATGETVRRRSVDTFQQLTPQESEISRLAGSGYTNSEIGLKLFISDRTVEWHLRKIFSKFGITSRRQLRDSHLDMETLSLSTV